MSPFNLLEEVFLAGGGERACPPLLQLPGQEAQRNSFLTQPLPPFSPPQKK